MHSPTGPSFLGLATDKKALTTFIASTEATLDSNVANIAPKTILTKSKARAPKGKFLGGSQKPRPSQVGLSGLYSTRQSPASVWKVVNSTSFVTSSSLPFGMNDFVDLNEGVNFMGFMAGGSKVEGAESTCKGAEFPKENHEEAVQPAREVMRADSPIECSQHHCEPDLAFVAEKSKHITPKEELVIKVRETALLVIPKELLKRIDPSLRPNKSDIVEANVNRGEELGPSMRDDEASADTDMQSEQRGEFSS